MGKNAEVTSHSQAFRIIPAHSGDVDDILDIIRDVFESYGMIYDPKNDFPDLVRYDEHYPPDQTELFVIKKDDCITGCGGVRVDEHDVPYLTRIYISPKHQGQKLGETLVRFLIAEAFEKNDRVYLWTDTRFEKAHHLYDKLGFVSDGRKRPLHDINISYEWYYELDRRNYNLP